MLVAYVVGQEMNPDGVIVKLMLSFDLMGPSLRDVVFSKVLYVCMYE